LGGGNFGAEAPGRADGPLRASVNKIFVDGIFIKGDRLFLLDKVRGVQFHEFKIAG
jgi:hypothetical protein